MRAYIFLFLTLAAAPASGANNSSTNLDIFTDCIALVRSAEGEANHSGGRCFGFIEALLPGLNAIHQHYELAFPHLKYPIRDQATANRFIATGLLVGTNVCMPRQTTPYAIAKIIVNYGNAHTEQLNEGSFFQFSSQALAVAYSCAKLQQSR